MATITNFAYKGRGRVYFDGRELGNVSACDLSFTVEEQTQKDFRTCAGGNYASSIDINECNLALTLHDLSPENMSMAFYGDTSAVAAGAVSDESIAAPSDLAVGADRLVITDYTIDTGETVTLTTDPAGTTYTKDTDFSVRSAGVILLGAGAISASEALLVDYTKRATTRVEALMSSSASGELVIDGLNCAQSGAPVVVRAWDYKPSPAEAFQLISEEFAAFSLNGKCDADTTKGVGYSQYFQADVATTT